MLHDRSAKQRFPIRDLKAQSEFYESQLGQRSSACTDAESWLASQPAGDADATASSRAMRRNDWLLAEGCEDCVRDLAASTAGHTRESWQ